MKAVQIADNIYDVGVNDWNIRDFHGYSTHSGTSYNAFLIVDDQIALIDTVKKEFSDQMLANIASVVDPARIDLVISNHTEMDHSGGLPHLMHRIGESKPLICSKMGARHLQQHYRRPWNLKVVENGEVLSLGQNSLTFLETRMLHWPDSMFTYLNEKQILFSSDAFGQHYAGYDKFDDQLTVDIMPHAQKYFANILLLYAPRIIKLVEQVQAMKLHINMICPDHGIIWRNNPNRIIEAYYNWSQQRPQAKAVLVYDSMWQSTEKMAWAIADGLASGGIAVRPMHLRKWHRSDIMTDVLDAGAVVIGSPTLNNGLFPTVSDFLTYMKGLKPKNKIGAAFGSYGWSGEAAGLIASELQAMQFDMLDNHLRVQYVPDSEALSNCYALGQKVAAKLQARLSETA